MSQLFTLHLSQSALLTQSNIRHGCSGRRHDMLLSLRWANPPDLRYATTGLRDVVASSALPPTQAIWWTQRRFGITMHRKTHRAAPCHVRESNE